MSPKSRRFIAAFNSASLLKRRKEKNVWIVMQWLKPNTFTRIFKHLMSIVVMHRNLQRRTRSQIGAGSSRDFSKFFRNHLIFLSWVVGAASMQHRTDGPKR